ncbi:MAG: alpha/beta hydrolase [Hylemonella sp.]|nr:alpha/beta hydrolase [Hylemonella sp.]
MNSPVLVVPGHGNSGPAHWQSIWQLQHPQWRRLTVQDWDHAICHDWVASIEQSIANTGPNTLIVAHSLGCLAAVHWAARTSRQIKGALLVAVPDPDSTVFPASDSIGFTPVPLGRLPFPSTLVASTDDPFGSATYARSCADAWGSQYVEIGPRGHVNASSGLADWPHGLELLKHLEIASAR